MVSTRSRRVSITLVVATFGLAHGLRTPLRQHVTAPRAPAVALGLFDNLANVAKNLPIQQMIDQRVAAVSQILMKPGGPMTIEQAYAQFDAWKQQIGDDPDTFERVAQEHSEDDQGGKKFFATRLKQLPPQLDDVIFVDDPQPGVYGPIASKQGLHLIYLHYCGDPTKMGGLAIFDPPNSIKKKLGGAFGRGEQDEQ